jgi:hypothetical protein
MTAGRGRIYSKEINTHLRSEAMIEQQAHYRRFSWPSFGLWVGLTLLGYFLSVGFHFPTGYASITFNPQAISLGSGLVGFLFGAESGVIIASLQWIVLKSWAPYTRPWIPLNAISFGLIHALGDAVPYMPVVLVGGGIIVGLAQYIALRHALTRAILWIPIAAVAWFSGFQLGFALPHTQGEYNLFIAALAYGVITGLALRLLLADNLAVPNNLLTPHSDKSLVISQSYWKNPANVVRHILRLE